MNTYRPNRRMLLGRGLIAALMCGALSCARDAAAEKVYVTDFGITNFLIHGLGVHDYLSGPGGVVPRYTGLPALPPTQQRYWRTATGQANQQAVVKPVRSRPAERFDEYNLSVILPGQPWKKLDPQDTGSRACLLLYRSNPTIYISLAAERADSDANVTNESLVRASQAKIESLPGGVAGTGKRWRANGIEGIAYEASAKAPDGDATVHYWIWVATHDGYSYSLAVYGEQNHKSVVDSTARDFVSGIRHIQPSRVARSGAKARR